MRADNISVAVETAVHDAMRQVAQLIWDMHGICVKSVRFSWIDVSSAGKHELLLNEVEAETVTIGGFQK